MTKKTLWMNQSAVQKLSQRYSDTQRSRYSNKDKEKETCPNEKTVSSTINLKYSDYKNKTKLPRVSQKVRKIIYSKTHAAEMTIFWFLH